MLKLRHILLYDFIYYLIISLALIYFLIITNINYQTKYNSFNNEKFTILNITKKDYGFEILLKGKEKVLSRYYLEENKQKEFLQEFNLGDKVLITGEKLEITNNTVPNTFNYKKYLYNNKIYNLIEITKIKKITNNKNIFLSFKIFLNKRSLKLKKSYTYINSLILGNNIIAKEIKETYSSNGISHLFAISGLHVSLFISIFMYILKKLKIKENKRYLIIILFLIFYMFLTNYQMSVLRACIFTILIIINKIFYFYIKPQNLLLVTLSIIIFINPFSLYNIGLQFSFTISLFLLISSNFINKRKSKVGKLFITSLVSFLASFPILINNFHEVNFLSLFLNILYVPYMSFILLPFTIISYIFPFLDNILFFLINILEVSSKFFSNIDFLKIIFCHMPYFLIIIYYILIFIFFKFNNYKTFLILILYFIIHYFSYFYSENYYMALDVGQGDCNILVLDKKVIVIDTGGYLTYDNNEYNYPNAKNKIIPYLKSKGIRKIDYLILTHGDADHMRDSIYLVNNFKINNIFINNNKLNSLEKSLINSIKNKNINIKKLKKDEIINFNKYKFYSLNTKGITENNSSIVLYLKYQNYKFLFMGDATKEEELKIIKNYNIKDIDFLKVGHHGSNTSSEKSFINSINPKYAIISVGKENKYGHPNKETLENLKNSKVYRTDKFGSIIFKFKNNKLKIITYAP